MAESWPISLPCPSIDGVTYASQDNAIRSQMDAGASKMRRRFTAVPETVTFRLELTEAQLQTLQDFVAVTLKDVLTFQWREFRKPDLTPVTYRFRKRPAISYADPHVWYADLELDLLTTFQGTFLTDIEGLST